MKTFSRLALPMLSVLTLTGCSLFTSLTPPPTPTTSPYVYVPSTPLPTIVPSFVPSQSPIPNSPSPTPSPSPIPNFPSPTTTVPVPPPALLSSSCLIGSWKADPTSLTSYMQAIYPTRITVISGSLGIVFGADGTFTQGVEHMVMETSLGEGLGNLSMEVNGSVRGNYQNTSPTVVTFSGIADSQFAVNNVMMNGNPVAQSPITFNNSFVNEGTVMNQLCTDNTLTVSWQLQGKTLTLILARVS